MASSTLSGKRREGVPEFVSALEALIRGVGNLEFHPCSKDDALDLVAGVAVKNIAAGVRIE